MVNENIKRLYKAMGLQKWLSGTQVNESVSIGRIESGPNGPNISDDKYISWLEEHPSALTSFHSMMKVNEGKQIIVFLDYDGTLSPIVDDPDLAFMSDPVYEFVKLDEIYYAGSHGMDIMGPPLHVKSYDDKFQSNIIDEKMLKELKKGTCEVPGALVEDNGFCVSVHYRHVLNKDYDILEEIIQNVLSEYNCFHVTRGIKVIEIRPSIKWNKGDALVYLLDTFGFDGSKDVIAFYLGDDKTDEDAFKVLESRGQGYPIIVSSVPKETSASHSLRDPSEVLSFLLRLARLGEALH
ncbi:hypothetical protein RD792_005470 [Penstemon davidsonii]|uniref:Trehalose 6-phosphate phosphatase n=1 Tax=Penstemon davidsonii TaxID=160366 RepID=A0ABR0DLH5_9LAMI|nr:hypothetical protein RD792_005470 [Penstemon davidsonii]